VFRVVSWNVRGINKSQARDAVKAAWHDLAPDVLCIQETNLLAMDRDEEKRTFRSIAAGGAAFCSRGHGEHGGVAVVMAEWLGVAVQEVVSEPRVVAVRCARRGAMYAVFGVYLPAGTTREDNEERDRTVSTVRRYRTRWCADLNVVCGDFNDDIGSARDRGTVASFMEGGFQDCNRAQRPSPGTCYHCEE
jgi:exonuclease III